MRSTLVTVLLGLSLVAGCEVGSAGGGGGGGGGDDTGGGGGGGGPDAAVAVPRLDVSIDKPSVATELASSNMVTVTLVGSGGFSGAVNLTGSVVDAAGAVIPGWTVTFSTATVNLAANGMGTAVATVMIPSDTVALAGKVKIDAVSTLGSQTVNSDVTALKQVTLNITENAQGQCVYPTATTMMNLAVKAGTKIRFVNKFTTDNVAIHSQAAVQGGTSAFNHETNTGHAPNTAYEVTVNAGSSSWYCHAPGPTVGNLKVTVVQ